MDRHRRRLTHRLLASPLALVAAAPLLGLVAGCQRADPPSFKAIDITGATYASGFDLPNVDGGRSTLADYRGKVTLVFFGFTQCPDVCPTTLLEIADAKKALGPAGDRVQGVLITVDPERDTPEVLKAYVGAFGPGFVALRGTEDETREVLKSFKASAAKGQPGAGGHYTVDHTAGIYVFDAQGRVRLFTRHSGGIDALKHDLALLLAEPAA